MPRRTQKLVNKKTVFRLYDTDRILYFRSLDNEKKHMLINCTVLMNLSSVFDNI